MKLGASQSASARSKKAVNRRGGIAFREDKKTLTRDNRASASRNVKNERDNVTKHVEEAHLPYVKPSWDVRPEEGRENRYRNNKKLILPSMLNVDECDPLREVKYLQTAGINKNLKGGAINLLQRTLTNAESHNRDFEKKLMWESYAKLLKYDSSKSWESHTQGHR